MLQTLVRLVSGNAPAHSSILVTRFLAENRLLLSAALYTRYICALRTFFQLKAVIKRERFYRPQKNDKNIANNSVKRFFQSFPATARNCSYRNRMGLCRKLNTYVCPKSYVFCLRKNQSPDFLNSSRIQLLFRYVNNCIDYVRLPPVCRVLTWLVYPYVCLVATGRVFFFLYYRRASTLTRRNKSNCFSVEKSVCRRDTAETRRVTRYAEGGEHKQTGVSTFKRRNEFNRKRNNDVQIKTT